MQKIIMAIAIISGGMAIIRWDCLVDMVHLLAGLIIQTVISKDIRLIIMIPTAVKNRWIWGSGGR